MSDEHFADCRWQRTTPSECVYRETHHYCPHPEHACTCGPPATSPDSGRRDANLRKECAMALADAARKMLDAAQDVYGRADWEAKRAIDDAALAASAPVAPPTMTDLMVTPETIDTSDAPVAPPETADAAWRDGYNAGFKDAAPPAGGTRAADLWAILSRMRGYAARHCDPLVGMTDLICELEAALAAPGAGTTEREGVT